MGMHLGLSGGVYRNAACSYISVLINIARAQAQATDCHCSCSLGGPGTVLALVNFLDPSQLHSGSWHFPETIPKKAVRCHYLEQRREWAWPAGLSHRINLSCGSAYFWSMVWVKFCFRDPILWGRIQHSYFWPLLSEIPRLSSRTRCLREYRKLGFSKGRSIPLSYQFGKDR